MIDSDARAFQSSLKCRFFDPSLQHSIRESRTYFNVFFDPYEIEPPELLEVEKTLH